LLAICDHPSLFSLSWLLQIMRVIRQVSTSAENANNILVSGALASVIAIISGVIEDAPTSHLKCRESVLYCVGVIRNIAKTGPVCRDGVHPSRRCSLARVGGRRRAVLTRRSRCVVCVAPRGHVPLR
jgi:hypothetical protein